MFCGLLAVPLAGLQYVIVVFPDHTHLLFGVSVIQVQRKVYAQNTGCPLSHAFPGKVLLG